MESIEIEKDWEEFKQSYEMKLSSHSYREQGLSPEDSLSNLIKIDPESKSLNKRVDEISSARGQKLLNLSCGHLREIKEIRKEIDQEYQGVRPQCFFKIDPKCK